MRRYSALAITMLLAACSAPVERAPAPLPSPPPAAARLQRGILVGRTAADLIATFGAPALQVREGSSVKLQFRKSNCVLDAYLYPSSAGVRVTHVDTRTPAGADSDQAACIADLSTAN